MNVITLYDQLTTTWERIRASILSHAIAAALLWFVGFAPPLPEASFPDLTTLPNHPAYKMFQSVGILATASLGLAVVAGAYAIALREFGRILSNGVMMLMPPAVSLSRSRKLIPADVLFNIAATLKGGTYEAKVLEAQMSTLLSSYAATQPEELRKVLGSHGDLHRDASTHFGNASVFVVAWICAPWLLPEGSMLALAVKAVFWRGLGMLMIYLVVARARLVFDLQLAQVWAAQAVATLIEKDNFYKDRLIAARSTPEPYWELVYRYLREEREDPTPSLVAYFVALLSRHRAKFNQVLTNDRKKRGHVREPFQDIRRFGWDEEVNRNYKDPIWLLRYAGWRALRTVDMIWALVRSILMTLGLWRL